MADYAQIINGKVNMIVIDDVATFNELVASGLTIIDVTSVNPKPSTGWTYDGQDFAAPILQWAKIVDDAVDSLLDLNYADAQTQISGGNTLIELTFIEPKPEVGWSYVDSVFSAP